MDPADVWRGDDNDIAMRLAAYARLATMIQEAQADG